MSYADADVSEEEYFDEEELFYSDGEFENDGDEEVYVVNKNRRKEKEEERKKHVDEIWTSFKGDTKEGKKQEIENVSKSSPIKNKSVKQTESSKQQVVDAKEAVEDKASEPVSIDATAANGEKKGTDAAVEERLHENKIDEPSKSNIPQENDAKKSENNIQLSTEENQKDNTGEKIPAEKSVVEDKKIENKEADKKTEKKEEEEKAGNDKIKQCDVAKVSTASESTASSEKKVTLISTTGNFVLKYLQGFLDFLKYRR